MTTRAEGREFTAKHAKFAKIGGGVFLGDLGVLGGHLDACGAYRSS
jgi:hypothetical protein